jgi:uncharacterized protein (UPF0261 family)
MHALCGGRATPIAALKPGIVVAATLDTKGQQVDFLRRELAARGLSAIVVDCSIRPSDGWHVDVAAEDVARYAGTDIETVRAWPERAPALEQMLAGVQACVADLLRHGKVAGFIGVGGGTNASLAARAFRVLPYGMPKVLVSTVVSGDTKPFIQGRDVVLVHSVVDFIGLNSPLRASLARAAGAMAAMLEIPFWDDAGPSPTVVGVTASGVTTVAAEIADRRFRAQGLETYEFHARGPGGLAFEDLIAQGRVHAAFDLTTTEITDEVVGGMRSAGADRLGAAMRAGIPTVVIPGGVDIVNFSGPETVPAKFEGRVFVTHTPSSTLMRTSVDESEAVGAWIGEKLSAARGPASVFVPSRGFSALDREGAPFHDPHATRAFVAGLQRALARRADIPVDVLDAHINDAAFVNAACERLSGYLNSGSTPRRKEA